MQSFFVRVLCLPENKDCRRLGVEKWIQTKCRQLYIFRIHNLGGIHRESLSLRLSMSGHLYGSAARNEYVEMVSVHHHFSCAYNLVKHYILGTAVICKTGVFGVLRVCPRTVEHKFS